MYNRESSRACTGGTIALAESDEYPLEGTLPDGKPYVAKVRVTRPHALVMLKLLALYDRYHNIRGPKEARHDREEAQTHATGNKPERIMAPQPQRTSPDPGLVVRHILKTLANRLQITSR